MLLKVWCMENSTSICIIWKLLRNAHSPVPPQTYHMGICIVTRSPGDACAHSTLRSTALEIARCTLEENVLFLSETAEREHMKRSWPTDNKKWKGEIKKINHKYTKTDIFTKHPHSLPMSPINHKTFLSLLGGNISLMEIHTSSAVDNPQTLLSLESVLL